MIQRYLGNKSKMLAPLLEVFAQHATPGDHVVDLFSGSLSVAMAMKAEGYQVSANDINLLSSIIGEAFLAPTRVPETSVDLIPAAARSAVMARARETISSDSGFRATAASGQAAAAERLTALVHWLNVVTAQDVPRAARRSDFFDTYAEEGANSGFVSSRGTSGRRRFFSGANAHRIDLALGQIRTWSRDGQLSVATQSYLLACLMRSVEKVANTQGTFHDFPRDRWDQRALNPIAIAPLPTDSMLSTAVGHKVGREEDSREFVKGLEAHSVLYLDPPYNFRQYTAYYFLLNVLCRYPEIEDLDAYFAGATYVRGQNPEDDFSSTFCGARTFIPDMGAVMRDARCETVVVSYYTGRNHWSQFDSDRDDTGLELLSELMTGTMFESGTFEVREVERRNYASYGGYKARNIHELILVAKKRRQGAGTGSANARISNVA